MYCNFNQSFCLFVCLFVCFSGSVDATLCGQPSDYPLPCTSVLNQFKGTVHTGMRSGPENSFVFPSCPFLSGFENFEKLLSGAHWMVCTSLT